MSITFAFFRSQCVRTLLVPLLLLPAWLPGYPLTPDAGETPGDLCTTSTGDFSEYRYPEKIPYCRRNVSSSLKRTIYQKYEIPVGDRTQYTIDHLVPLSLGGSNARKNLWPEHKEVKALRPQLELTLFISLRDGSITQREAIDTIVEAKFNPCSTEMETPKPRRDACRAANSEPVFLRPLSAH